MQQMRWAVTAAAVASAIGLMAVTTLEARTRLLDGNIGVAEALPPEQYDHPFDGKVGTTIIQTAEDLQTVCNIKPVLACSRVVGGTCMVYRLPDAQLEASHHPVEIVMRHEIGHCNGWGADHAGARTWLRPWMGIPEAPNGWGWHDGVRANGKIDQLKTQGITQQ